MLIIFTSGVILDCNILILFNCNYFVVKNYNYL